MKSIRNVLASLIVFGGFVASINLLYAQETGTLAQSETGSVAATTDASALSDVEVEVKAVEMTTPLPAAAAPESGNFYSTQHLPGTADEWPPLPADTLNLPVWPLGDDFYLLADENVDYAALQTQSLSASGGMRAMTDFAPLDLVSSTLVAGTNLWLAITNLADGTAGLRLSNTLADVEYEIQATTNLTQSQWVSIGTVLGSEITNWTAASVAAAGDPALFLRVRSDLDSDDIGIPDWWQLEYFGYVGIDPNGDPAGDGWSNAQKYEYGMNPKVFDTPPAPQGLTVTYNSSNSTATVTWLPSPGAVTGYTLETPNGNYNLPASTTSYVDTDLPSADPGQSDYSGATIFGNYYIYASYADGNSALSAAVPLEPNALALYPESINFVAGPQGTAYLAARSFPSGTKAVRLSGYDDFDNSFDTNIDFPVGSFTNGLCLLPASVAFPPEDSYGFRDCYWWVQLVYSNGDLSAAQTWFNQYGQQPYYGFDFALETVNQYDQYPVPPYFDGRQQLKQNLIFLLRAATVTSPFYFIEYDGAGYSTTYTNTSNYACSGFYQLDDPSTADYYDSGNYGSFDVFELYQNNALYRNFVFNSGNIDSYGFLTTGASGSYIDGHGNYDPANALILSAPATYQFSVPTTVGTTITSLLATNDTQWLATYPFDSPDSYLWEIGITTNGAGTYFMSSTARNWFGLPFKSATIGYQTGTTVLSAGGSTTQGGYFYPETAQPQFQTVEYDFWNTSWDNSSSVPGSPAFSPTNNNQLLITSVGNQHFQVAGYAKLAVLNGYPGVYGYLGQYFDQAYQITNGVATTNTTGVLSPYGQFFATQPGPTALVTMPDPDTGARGTCTVYAVSLNLDANHDGTMDTSFNGPDATSPSSPMECWVNDGLIVPGTDGNLDKDVEVFTNTPPNYSYGQITCPRDLENFFRLWVCGMPPLPYSQGYTVTLSMSPISGNPAINLYYSCETNGGIGYLTNADIAAAQTGSAYYDDALGTISNSQNLTLQMDSYGNLLYTNYLFEGAGIGEGQFTLTIYQNGNTIAQTSTYIDLHDVKDFYERAVITNDTSGAISNWSSTVEPLQNQITSISDEDSNIIVFVHGFNVGPWDWLDDSDTVFKRLYWVGYQGRFASVKWPCELTPLLFDPSELDAYKASTGLKTYLSGLRTRFPSYRLNILAHSQGNAIVSEAIEQGAPFNTYILSQGAMPASCYDVNAATDPYLTSAEYPPFLTPDWKPMGYHGVYTNLPGRIVSFYNPVDYALQTGTTLGLQTNWRRDQTLKPNSGYYSDGTNVWDEGMPVTDSEESRAMVARSRTDAVGAQAGLNGVIQSSVDLNAQFQFGRTVDEHSAQWTRPIQTSLSYYYQVLNSLNP